MKNKNLSWFAALLVFALLLWCTAATPGKIADPSTYTCAVYSTIFSLLPPVIAIVLALNTKEVYTSLLVGIASGALLYATAIWNWPSTPCSSTKTAAWSPSSRTAAMWAS